MGFVLLVIILAIILAGLGFVIYSLSNRLESQDKYISHLIDNKHTLDKVERLALDSQHTEPLLADMILNTIRTDRKAL